MILIVVCSGCGFVTGERLPKALEAAGNNRRQLQGVLDHFAADPEKLVGAEYIIANMPGNYSRIGRDLNRYLNYYHLFSIYGKQGLPTIDSMIMIDGNIDISRFNIREDVGYMDSTYLIQDMEKAYNTWRELPWCKTVTESQFIRYVLPYRIKDETLTAWRDSVFRSFQPVIDSLKSEGCGSVLEAARKVMAVWNQKEFKWTGQLPSGPAIGIANVYDKAGTCLEFAHGVVYLMRAMGIPSGVDMVPVRGENNSSHFWPFILDGKGNTYVASTENPDWIPASDFEIYGAKIYRLEYGMNDDYEVSMRNGNLPPFFSFPRFSDVSSEYKPGSLLHISVDLPEVPEKGLLLLSSRDSWIPVALTEEDGRCEFGEIAGGVVAWIGEWKNGTALPVSDPFFISPTDGEPRFINEKGDSTELTVFCKFPLSERNGDIVGRVVGGVIEGSETMDFRRCDTIFQIMDSPKRKINFVRLDEETPSYRYYRYRGAEGTYCNIAEVALYADSDGKEILTGHCFGTSDNENDDTTHTYEKVFDGDLDTSFDYKYPSGGWSALDLGIPRSVRSIMFAPRNRDNYVREGDTYELFYFSDLRWNSAGRKTAESDSLSFIVPSGMLYYLKNHSRGKDERIFEYDFDRREQIFR